MAMPSAVQVRRHLDKQYISHLTEDHEGLNNAIPLGSPLVTVNPGRRLAAGRSIASPSRVVNG